MFGSNLDGLREEIRRLRLQIEDLRAEHNDLESAATLKDQINKLKKDLVDQQIKSDRVKEEHAREERELKHMIGLERKRQEVETDHAKRDAVLTVREENLSASQERFEEQMSFHRERFETEVGYLKDMIGQILDRLPTVTVNKAASK